MSENIIIELKQSDGTTIQGGEYSNVLSKPITVYEGDEIAVNRIFIDTEAQTDALIHIPFDIEIRTSQVLGITNDNLAKFNSFSDASVIIDGIDYFVYDSVPAGTAAEADMIQITQFNISRASGKSDKIGDPDGSNPIEFVYEDYLGQQRSAYISFPQQNAAGKLVNDFNLSLFVKENGNPRTNQNLNIQIKQTPDNILRCANCNFPSFIPANREAGDTKWSVQTTNKNDGTFNKANLTPHAFKFSTVIEEGKYLATDLATIITDRMSVNGHTKTFTIANNVASPFLINSSSLNNQTLVANFEGTGGLPLADMRTATPNANFFIGTNQVELLFNTTTNRFYWNFLHFPVYTTTGVVSTRVIPQVLPNFMMQTRNGCAAFLDLTAVKNGTEEPFAFWDGKLGFQLNQICCNTTHKLDFNDNGNLFHAELVTVNDGINTTNAKVSLDSVVVKSLVDYKYQKCITGLEDFVQSNLNESVEAENIVVSQVADITDPYFLVEVNAGFKTNFLSTNNNSSNIQAIVNRYYSKGSYTTGEDSSLAYQHRGVPLVLSKFYTRILDTKRNVPERLGTDNTIFIEIARGQEFLQMQEQLSQPEKKNKD